MRETVDFLLSENYYNLQKYARHLCENDYDADDLTQDTALRILEKHELYDPKVNFLFWAQRTMKNVFLNHLRSEGIRSWDDLSEEFIGETSAEYNNLVEAINKILTPEQSECFWLWYNGHSYQDISEKLGIPSGTAKSRVSYGKRKLKIRFKDPSNSYI